MSSSVTVIDIGFIKVERVPRTWKLQFSDRQLQCKFPTAEIIGARMFQFRFEIFPKMGVFKQILYFFKKMPTG